MDYQLMPELSDDEYQHLKDDIAKNGVLVPVEFNADGDCLDGYNRLRACDELGIEDYPKTIRAGLDFDKADELAVTLNLTRRQLTREQKIEIAKKLKGRHHEWPVSKIANLVGMQRGDLSECLGGQCEQMDTLPTVKRSNGRRYPTSEYAQQQREDIRQTISEHPDWSDRKVADEVGVSHRTVALHRKRMADGSQDPEESELDEDDPDDIPFDLGDTDAAEPIQKMVTVMNPSNRDAEALKDPDIVERLATDSKLNVAGAIREQKRDRIVERLESVEQQETKAIEGIYDVIVVDPPWPMSKIERDERPNQSEFDYPTMSLDEIKALKIPAAEDCHVFLWTTQKFLRSAFDVLDAWGITHCWTFVWHKDNGYKPFGLPMSNGEFILYGHVGNPKFVDETDFWTVFNAPTRGHSVKPAEFYETICRVTAGRRLDMFSRREIEGFDAWGKEAGGCN